jgi:hypothetical protein
LDEGADVVQHLDSDRVNITLAGGASLLNGFNPEELLHGGHHFDDVSHGIQVSRKKSEVLPCEIMCNLVEEYDLRRPTPKEWQGQQPASNM